MEQTKIINLQFASSLTDICEVNSSFDRGILRVAYPGDNQNMTSISREAFEKAMPSIYNVPVVANYSVQDNRIGGHDVGVVKTNDGDLKLVNYTEPLGVVPESAKQYFEKVEEEDGSVHDYLYTEVLLWKRQPVYSKIKSDGVTSHSMEIKVKDGFKADNIFHIEDFEFTAFCLLGDGVQPCFESSSLEVFSVDFKRQMSEMMQELKETYSSVNSSTDDNDINTEKYSTEGGEKALDVKIELAAKYGIDVESLDFSIEDLTVEELTKKFEEMTAESNQNSEEQQAFEADTGSQSEENDGATEETKDEAGNEETFALTQQIVNEICRQLCEEKFETAWGIESRYIYIDCDFSANEVYAYDEADWLVYGFNYTLSGDAVSIDFDSKKRKKFTIVDFEGEEVASPIAGVFARITDAVSHTADIEQKYNEASEKLTEAMSELETLRKYKTDTEEKEAKVARDEVFALFKDLEGIDAFENLRANCDSMDATQLRKECFAIRGEFGTSVNFSTENTQKSPKLIVGRHEEERKPYGGIVEEYASKNK